MASDGDESNVIAVEEDQGAINDADSAFGDADNESAYSASLTSTVYNHVYENGRRYHSYREGTYLNPDDEDEQDRLDLHHHIWKLTLNGALHTAPLKDPLEILDIGTGTGLWAIDVAEEFPAAVVTGTDISPIQPQWVPPNCHFYIDDAESDWVYKKPFDFVHGRALGGVIGDWKKLHTQAFRSLKPGGWFELQDIGGFMYCDDGTMGDDSWIVQWTGEMDRGSTIFGKNYNAGAEQKQHLIDAGFVNVSEQIIKVPVGVWAKNKKLKEIGRFMEVMLCKAAESYTPAMYTRVLGYSLDQTRITIEHLKQEFCDRRMHKYCKWHFLIGQKPET